jgi:hypothetical protein
MVELLSLETAVVVALNVPVVPAAATVTDAGTLSVAFVLVSVTLAPPAGAALLNVTVQVLEAFGPRLVGLHASDETVVGATSVIVTLRDAPLRVAVTEPDWFELNELACRAKLAALDPHPTSTDAGALRTPLTVEIVMLTPPKGAFLLIPIVQPVEEDGPIVVCTQEREDTRIGAPKVIVVFAELPL